MCMFYVCVLTSEVCSGNLTVRFVASNVAFGSGWPKWMADSSLRTLRE